MVYTVIFALLMHSCFASIFIDHPEASINYQNLIYHPHAVAKSFIYRTDHIPTRTDSLVLFPLSPTNFQLLVPLVYLKKDCPESGGIEKEEGTKEETAMTQMVLIRK
ncbi:hypothetical protein ABEB36_000669 [Hypothenemus hampei]|uniref:Uncharacterized protein n=1 Tax=Hypothenemus hampei TaxID=57062 RepID=A0ABD1FC36_HYPHA